MAGVRSSGRLVSLLLTLVVVSACSGGQAPSPPPTVAAETAATTGSPSSLPSVAPTTAPSTAPNPTASHAPDTGKIVMKADGFAITLPAGWRAIPLDGSATAGIEALLPAGSSIKAALDAELAQAVASGFAFMAIDLRPATLAAGNTSTVNVNVQAASNVPLDLMEPLVTGLLDSAPGISNVVAKQVTLPAGRALRITYTLALKTSTGTTVKLAGTQFVLLSSKHTFTISFGCQYAMASSCRSQADAMMKTFEIL